VTVRLNLAAIRAFLEDPSGQVTRDIDARAARIEAYQHARCPVLTGHLKSTIGISRRGTARDIGASADYAIYVVIGTSDTPRQDFVRPSLQAGR
jgi:hypothetical protein